MKIITPLDITALRGKRNFKKHATACLDLSYRIALSPNGQMRLDCWDFYNVVARPGSDFNSYFSTLFPEIGGYKPGTRCKTYSTLDPAPLQSWAEHVEIGNSFVDYANDNNRTFLDTPGPRSEMKRTGNRVYPWWATMRSAWRRELFMQEHGILYDYDIANAKATLMLQGYDKFRGNKWRWSDSSWDVPTWRRYVADKQGVRDELARDLGWTKDRTKSALQVICNGGYVTGRGSLANETELAQHPIYLGLRQDLLHIWEVVKGQKKAGETRGECLSRVYTETEDRVMDAIEEITGQMWWVHDGFMSQSRVNTDEVSAHIKSKLGLEIQVEEDIYRRRDTEKNPAPSRAGTHMHTTFLFATGLERVIKTQSLITERNI